MSALKGKQKDFKARLFKVVTDSGYPPDCVKVKFYNNPFSLIIEITHFECFTLRNKIKNFVSAEFGYLEEDQGWNDFGCSASVSYK